MDRLEKARAGTFGCLAGMPLEVALLAAELCCMNCMRMYETNSYSQEYT